MERNKNSGKKNAGPWKKSQGDGHSPYKKTRGHTGSRKLNIPKFDETVRLNKYLANAGVCTRREADTIIQSGAVQVNGVHVTELGIKVNPDKDVVKYGGQTLSLETKRYVLLNKPKDFVSNAYDLDHKRSVLSLVKSACKEVILPVGQLDRNSTGLLLFTNDSDLLKKLTHPKVIVPQMYQVSLKKPLSDAQLQIMRTEGVKLDRIIYKPSAVAFVQNESSGKEIGIEIRSNRSNIIKRIFEFFDNEVLRMDRVTYVGLNKRDLPRGKYRLLNPQEIQNLKNL